MCRRRDNVLNCRGGFTLVELLVVIAIIALLMSILMPALARTRKQAKTVVCQQNLHEWGYAFQLFAHDNDGKFMKSATNVTGNAEDYWLVGLLRYIGAEFDEVSKTRKLFLCPMAAKSLNPPESNRLPGTTFSAWGPFHAYGSAWGRLITNGSFGINDWCANPPVDYDTYWGFPSKYAWRSIAAKGAGNIPLLLDCIYSDGFPLHVDEPPEYPGQYDGGSGCWGDNAMKIFCIDRHSGAIDGLFVDSSVRKIGLKELWTLKWHRGFKLDNAWTTLGGVTPQNWPEWMRNFREY
ncbi:MAG: type II secretion system protein [Planctomycetota bacterium]|jgi:prepilin-type N-terminal cleavage/methylation domain-containing protein